MDFQAHGWQTAAMRHLCFSMSGAESLCEALRDAERDELVIRGLFDDLSMGPINDVCSAERQAWLQDILHGGDVFADWDAHMHFWSSINLMQTDDVTIWYSSRNARDYCGFLEFLRRLPADADLIAANIADGNFSAKFGAEAEQPIYSTGLLLPHHWVSAFALARMRARREYAKELENWERLREENAPLRVFRDGRLISAKEDFYDQGLFRHLSDRWRKVAYVVGRTMMDFSDMPEPQMISDLWLDHRINVLVDAGMIKEIGEGDMRHREIRLKA
ncbi:DUF3658 domain-containing protein [Aestuariivirga sp.]|uniref:DUF3658 domain-containing protein n=1 Tax=Aestuariivirga sp. TaxID=2650926 RepID=UPI0039E3AB37